MTVDAYMNGHSRTGAHMNMFAATWMKPGQAQDRSNPSMRGKSLKVLALCESLLATLATGREKVNFL